MRPADADIWRECSRCRYPMLRWAKLRGAVPQRGLPKLELKLPPVHSAFSTHAKQGGGTLIFVGLYLVRLVIDEIDVQLRRRKYRQLFEVAAPNDWVCANCLHSERSA